MSVRILIGDCRDVLQSLPADSVHCCVTSPPYWGLRNYKIPPIVWGDDDGCEHEWGARNTNKEAGSFCRRCGAWAGAHGLEPTFDLYIDHEVEIFREVRRVLRADGTLWLNLGDSYATGAGKVGSRPGGGARGDQWAGYRGDRNGHEGKHGYIGEHGIGPMTSPNRMPQPGLKPKDLCGIPWRVALALQADGWWLRQDIIWSKPNPMPESVLDRCTKAHEYLFLLSKSERYYFDGDAIAEPAVKAGLVLHSYGTAAKDRQDVSETNDRRTRIGLANWNQAQPETRNKRSVWECSTQPFADAHFATFPPLLIEPCVKAGAPAGGVVLDPFGGAGTTGLVADRLCRDSILIELNPAYAAMAEKRIRSDAPLLQWLQANEPAA